MAAKSKKPPQCVHTIPELTVHTGSEMVKVAEAVTEEVENENGHKVKRLVTPEKWERNILMETIPEHRCEEPATSLERDLEEVDLPGIHGTSHKIVDERPKCTAHAGMGVIKNLDGSEGRHAIMSVADDTGVRRKK